MTKTNNTTVVGVFHDHSRVEEAVRALRKAGFREDQISVVSKGHDGEAHAEGNKAATGAMAGAATGAGVAALASLGMSFGVIPIIGPILAVGPLAAALISAVGGVAAGGLVGGLIGVGIPEHEAKYYEGEVKSGRTLITVHADTRSTEAWTILQSHGAYNKQTAAVSSSKAAATGYATHDQEGQTLKLHEEELHARKTPVKTGEVRVHKEVITEQQTLTVPVQREEVVIERRPASGMASASDLHAGEEIRIPVKEEKVRIEKDTVLKEEVHVGKRKIQETESVSGTVRKERVKVEQEGTVEVHTDTAGGTKRK